MRTVYSTALGFNSAAVATAVIRAWRWSVLGHFEYCILFEHVYNTLIINANKSMTAPPHSRQPAEEGIGVLRGLMTRTIWISLSSSSL